MKFVWNESDARIGYYSCELIDDDGSELQKIFFIDNTNCWNKENDALNGFKRAYSFEVPYCDGDTTCEGFDYDKEYRSRPGGGYQGVCTHTVEDVKRWCEEYLAKKYIDHYKEMLAELDTAKRRAECLKNMGYGNDKENKTSDNQEKRFWETDMELRFGNDSFSAPAADLMKLPVGTAFHVVNGEWDGEIVEKDGKKAIHVFETDNVITINETNRYGLALSNVVLPQEQENSKEEEDERDL